MDTATTLVEALGGWDNISNLEACITRIRLDAANTDLIDEVLGVGAHDDLHGVTNDDDVEGSGFAQLGLVDEVGVGRIETDACDARF